MPVRDLAGSATGTTGAGVVAEGMRMRVLAPARLKLAARVENGDHVAGTVGTESHANLVLADADRSDSVELSGRVDPLVLKTFGRG